MNKQLIWTDTEEKVKRKKIKGKERSRKSIADYNYKYRRWIQIILDSTLDLA